MSLFHRKTRQAGLLFLFLAFFPGSSIWGGEAVMSSHKRKNGDPQTKNIALSLRIAEAKGKDNVRRVFQSLLRQRKRKSFRQDP